MAWNRLADKEKNQPTPMPWFGDKNLIIQFA
jgi:hypothetical protein